MNEQDKRVERRMGGWFVIDEGPRGWSGPWRTEAAANLAMVGKYKEALAAEKRS